MKVISPKRLLQSVFPTVRNGSIFNASSLDLQFARTKTLDPRVTFTRASSGTYVDSQGVIRTATTNLLLRSEEFNDATSWTVSNAAITANAITAPNGQQTADKLVEDTAASIGHFVRPTPSPSLIAGQSYAYSVFAKAAERTFLQLIFTGVGPGGANIIAGFDLSTGQAGTPSSGSSSIVDIGNGWYRCSLLITASTTATSLAQIRLAQNSAGAASSYTGNGTSGIYLWGAQLEQSSTVGEYIPTTSTINSAPRFDHNPTTGESLGLLVEEQRTNLCLQSQDLATTWAATSASVSTNTTTAPDGTLTADTITASSSTLGRVQQTITFTGDGDKAISVWLKAGTAPTSVVKIDDSSAGFVNRLLITVTWTAGVASAAASNGTVQGVDTFPNGWYRIRGLALGVVAANTNRYRIEADSTNGTGSVIAWGAQAENGTFTTSYIPTTTSTVTRSADVASITGSNFSSWYRQDEGTVFADAKEYSFASSASRTFYAIDNSTAPNTDYIRQWIWSGNTSLLLNSIYTSISGPVAAEFTQSLANEQKIVALAYKINDFARSYKGAAAVSDASGNLPNTIDRLGIGNSNQSQYLSGHIRRLTYWPQRLSNSTLQQITQ